MLVEATYGSRLQDKEATDRQVKLHLEAKKAAEDQLKAQLDANKKLTLLNNLTRNKETKKIASEKEQVNEKLICLFFSLLFHFIFFGRVFFAFSYVFTLHFSMLELYSKERDRISGSQRRRALKGSSRIFDQLGVDVSRLEEFNLRVLKISSE